jgi:GGDEF domain-containing protein
MNSLRRSIIALLLWLTIFFNIERLDIAGNDTINLETGVYFVAIAAMLLPLLSFFQRRSAIVAVIPTLLLLALALIVTPTPDLGGIHTYITVVEITMLTVLTVLAHRVGQHLEEFRRAVEVVTLKDKTSRLHSMADAHDLVQTEMSSSRRSQRPLSLLVFQADASSLNMMMHRFVQELQRGMMQRYVLTMTARVLSRHLRRTDLIIEEGKPGRLVLVAPETSSENARLLGKRLIHLVQDRLGITARFGIAAFPEQALTFDELLSVAEGGLRDEQLAESGYEVDQDVLHLPEVRT